MQQRKPWKRKQISQIVSDRRGNDSGDLAAEFVEFFHLGFWKTLRLSLHPPPGVSWIVWIPILASLICARAGLIAAYTPLVNIIRWLVGVLNKGSQDEELSPTPQQILDIALRTSGTVWGAGKEEYLQSLRNQLQVLVQNAGHVFAARGLDLETQVIQPGKSIVIDMPNIFPPWLRLFVVDLLLLHVVLGRIHRRHHVANTEVIFYIDEADQDVSREAEACFGEDG